LPQFAMIWVDMNEMVLLNKLPRVIIILVGVLQHRHVDNRVWHSKCLNNKRATMGHE
jgi:hypothetical protein